MDQWVAAVLDTGEHPYWPARWPKATSYAIEHDPKRGPMIRGQGPTVSVDLTGLDPASELAAARGRDRLLRVVNRIGLTTPWIEARDGVPAVGQTPMRVKDGVY